MRFLLAFILCASTAVAGDDEPMIVVKAPKQTVAGRLVKIDASQSNVDSMEWHLVDGSAEDFDVAFDGKRATFSNPRPGVYFFAVAGAKLVDGKAVAVGVIIRVELISDPDKPPTIPTTPTVPPNTPNPPTIPDPPAASLAAWVQENASNLVVRDPTRGKTATALAASYRAWAKAGATSPDAQTFVFGTNKLLDLLLGQVNKQAAWKPFRDALDAKLGTLGLTTVAQHIAAWEQIAQGLERVN